ncbi:hypothetical protein Tbd_0352 [Thiobacillus denitrificans ATCC 25259]|uniref:Ice-binding protein C-terminal domain-containing protein n=1 Tax=Thiobacillus denitrificans (strain ATCC 25259 / T1) TaxID=292415 RepID=Q3SLU8_THIDA|nr:PEP-CTERM sorting domain-containing protein [Thiobacillus denitrificans]AAZ96305.1 hypothetical protein Tbd_0352 [Thiobacillus denitrificans ATCC 25259]
MNFKLNALVAAALLASGSAHAITATDDVATGNAYLLLTVLDANYNGGVGRSYTRSLEVAMNEFGTGNRTTGGFTTNVDSLGSSNQTWSTGALWGTFTAGMDAATIAGLQWDVTALDGFGTSSADQKRVLTTSATNLVDAQAAAGVATNNTELTFAVINQDVYWDAAIGAMGTDTEIIVDDTSSMAFAISAAVHSTNFSGKTPDFSTVGNVGDSMGFYYLTRSGSSNTAEATAVAYGVNGDATFTFAADGSLTFAPTVAAVPEASTYGMILAGLGLVGFMARRRVA